MMPAAPALRRLVLGAAMLSFGAAAQTPPSATPPPVTSPAAPLAPGVQDLYQDALQSIAEGRKDDASDTLARVIEKEPLHAGAWLDLALIQCGLGNAAEAERLFRAIEERFDPPPGILELIADARERGCARWEKHSQYSLTLGRGVDQNVNQGASNPHYIFDDQGTEADLAPDFLPKHDDYSLLSADYLTDLTANGSIGFAQFQERHNDRLHQYDSQSLFVGVDTPWRVGKWTMAGNASVGLITLGSQLYQRQVQLQARIGPPLPLPEHLQFTLISGVTHSDYMTLDNFNSNTLEVRGHLAYRGEKLFASAAASYLDDHAVGERPGGDRHGWLANLQLRRQIVHRVTGELDFTRQTWHGQTAYAPGLFDQVRDQSTQVWRSVLQYSLNKHQTLQLEARLVHNHENISIFQYNNRQLQLSWQWLGP